MPLTVRQNEVGYLDLEVRDREEQLVDPDVGTLTLLVTDSDGVALPGFPTLTAGRRSLGKYRYNFDATGLDVGHYIAIWTALINGEASTVSPDDDIYVTQAITVDTSDLVFTTDVDLQFTRGDTAIFAFALTMDGVALDLTGATIRWTAKPSVSDVSALISKAIGSGLTVADPTSGRVDLTFNPQDTRDLDAPATLYWDLEVTEANGYVSTPLIGTLRLDADIRQAGTGKTHWQLSVGELRLHVRTNVPDSVLRDLLDANAADIERVAGRTEAKTVIKRGDRSVWMTFPAPIAAVTSILESYLDPFVADTVLDDTDYILRDGGYTLERLPYGTHAAYGWADRTVVTYTPQTDDARRRGVLIRLVNLDLTNKPGLAAFRTGEYSESFRGESYQAQRDELLSSLIPNVWSFA